MKFKIIPASENVNKLLFNCPGCDEQHALNDTWTFNGDLENPTVSPSVLVRGWRSGKDGGAFVCHSFIKEGMIQFLDDCTHKLAGQTVELLNIE